MEHNDKIELLWISPMAPYDSVKHAGGKIHNFYTKSFINDNRFHVTLLTYCDAFEEELVEKEFSAIGMDCELVVRPKNKIGVLFWKVINAESVLNPFNRYAGITRNHIDIRFKSRIRKMISQGYNPDVIVMQWTQVNLLAPWVKSMFPNAKVVEIEEDYVTQGYSRQLDAQTSAYGKWRWSIRCKKIKKLELSSLQIADLVVVNNSKDKALIEAAGMTKPIFQWTPFFQNMLDLPRCYDGNHDIVFYGAMNRKENWMSVIWFIENVLPLIEDEDYSFKVIGGNPVAKLMNYENDRIHIVGYVDDIGEVFSKAMCIVAPLVLGAGIKIKVLEGMSAGIPILTNDIGIEGIPAKRDEDYFYCTSPDEYAHVLRNLMHGKVDNDAIGVKAKAFVEKNLNFEADAIRFCDIVFELSQK